MWVRLAIGGLGGFVVQKYCVGLWSAWGERDQTDAADRLVAWIDEADAALDGVQPRQLSPSLCHGQLQVLTSLPPPHWRSGHSQA
jgi:hypothetical protein